MSDMDSFTKNALSKLSPEDRMRYMKLGESMYKTINFTTSEILDNSNNPPNSEVLQYIEEALKSGLHPNELSDPEVKHMIKFRGLNWWRLFGYQDEDVKYTATIEEIV